MATALCVLVAGAFAQSTTPPAGMKERSNLRNVRYCEVLVVNKRFTSATASVYNTLGLNDCPESQWNSLDPTSCTRS